jgi:hypothetical protein
MITNANECVIIKPRFWHGGMKNDASFSFSQGLRFELPNGNNGDVFSNLHIRGRRGVWEFWHGE